MYSLRDQQYNLNMESLVLQASAQSRDEYNWSSLF